jgi:hypothetical protein
MAPHCPGPDHQPVQHPRNSPFNIFISNPEALNGRSSGVPESSREKFSEAECRVLQHAADILNVPFSEIVKVRQMLATRTPQPASPGLARPRAASKKTWPHQTADIPDIPDLPEIAEWPWHTALAAHGGVAPPQISSVPTFSLTSAQNVFDIQDALAAPKDSLDATFHGNIAFPLPEPAAWPSYHDAPLDLAGQDMISGHMSFPSADEIRWTQSSFIEPISIIDSSITGFGVLGSSINTAPLDTRIQGQRETAGARTIAIHPRHHENFTMHSSPRVIRRLAPWALHSAPEPSNMVGARQAAPAPLERTGHNTSEIRKPKRRGAFKPDERVETSLTRKVNACIRCHMQRGRVSSLNSR